MLTFKQERFLAASREEPTIARAARLARVNRTSVYRWLANPIFAAARADALDTFFRVHRAEVLKAEAARATWRAERERERRPMRCYHLAKARAAKLK